MSDTTTKGKLPEVEGVLQWPTDQPHLIGGKCQKCGARFFPTWYEVHRPDCSERKVEPLHLSGIGVLKSYTICYYPPPPPCIAKPPYAIGLVQFPEGLEVAGMVTRCRFEDLKIGMRMQVVYEELFNDSEGAVHLTWMYEPVLA